MKKINETYQNDSQEAAQKLAAEKAAPAIGFKVTTGIKAGWGLVVGGTAKGPLPKGM
jgi:hypothetical protein